MDFHVVMETDMPTRFSKYSTNNTRSDNKLLKNICTFSCSKNIVCYFLVTELHGHFFKTTQKTSNKLPKSVI